MAIPQNSKEVLQRASQLRRDHFHIRAEVAMRSALGITYSNGKHWTTLGGGPHGNVWADTWDEDWDPESSEVRIVDNRIGPLVRRIAASTNATLIETSVTPPDHERSFEASDLAAVSQDILNSLESTIQMTSAARGASSLRWRTGSSLIFLVLNQKKRLAPTNILRHPDGSPIEINDQWVRWDYAPLAELIWEASNIHWDLRRHHTLMMERVYTVRQFEQIFGPLKSYRLKEEDLPVMGELAPHYTQAAELAGSALYNSFSSNSQEKGLRVLTLIEADPRDPVKWPVLFNIVDTSKTSAGSQDELQGVVINMDNPENPFGGDGRFMVKLDAFRRDDAVLSHGAPHVTMQDNDRLNILRSIEFQHLASALHGVWMIDESSVSVEKFANDLAVGTGGILRWDSRNRQETNKPEFVSAPPPSTSYITMAADITAGMREQLHTTPANLGLGKTHIPQGSQDRLLQEAGVVLDNVSVEDSDAYSELLTITLGTIRHTMDQPNRMLARLRDANGFTVSDLETFRRLQPRNVTLRVRVRRHSVVSRSIAERRQELSNAVAEGSITPMQKAIAESEELERPIIRSHELQLQFCRRAIRLIIDGDDWPGIPNLNTDIFEHAALNAMWGLNMRSPEDREIMARLQKAVIVQKQLAIENDMQLQLDNGTGQGVRSSGNQGSSGGGLPQGVKIAGARGPSPESINPLTNPVGASGGLPAGLSS